jgi:hypothetical protein
MSEMQFLEESLKRFKALNEFLYPKALRRFQRDILATGKLEIISPWSGNTIEPKGNYLRANGGVVYWFEDLEPFCIVVASLRMGNPILALVTATDTIELAHKENSPIIQFARDLLRDNIVPPRWIDSGAKPALYIGHPNFAHLIWNEFPALLKVRELKADFDLRIFFDPISLLGPFCADNSIPHELANNLKDHTGWHTELCTEIGSSYCSEVAKAEILKYCDRKGVGKTPDNSFRIYISVRDQGRTIRNQQEFLRDLTGKILETFEKSVIIFDGFSLPDDFERDTYQGRSHIFQGRIDGAKKITDAIIKGIPEDKAARVTDITGLRFTEALGYIRGCDYYITHSGTAQHKIGWLFSVPGTLHGNLSSINESALAWNASTVGGALPPKGVNADLVRDLEISNMPNAVERNRDYEFLDQSRIIDDLVDDIRSAMDHRSDHFDPVR